MADIMWACHCRPEDQWPYPEYETKEEAIEAGRAQFDCDFRVGRKDEWWPSVNALSVIEDMQCEACDYVGEVAESWMEHIRFDSPETDALQERLQAVVDDWIREYHLEPNFFGITDIETVERMEEE